MNAFFRRAGVATLTMRELFDFVVDPTITNDNLDATLDHLRALVARYGRSHVQGVWISAGDSVYALRIWDLHQVCDAATLLTPSLWLRWVDFQGTLQPRAHFLRAAGR